MVKPVDFIFNCPDSAAQMITKSVHHAGDSAKLVHGTNRNSPCKVFLLGRKILKLRDYRSVGRSRVSFKGKGQAEDADEKNYQRDQYNKGISFQ